MNLGGAEGSSGEGTSGRGCGKNLADFIVRVEGVVEKDSLNQILVNIGRKDYMLSDEEYEMLCKEAGDDAGCLQTKSIIKLF